MNLITTRSEVIPVIPVALLHHSSRMIVPDRIKGLRLWLMCNCFA